MSYEQNQLNEYNSDIATFNAETQEQLMKLQMAKQAAAQKVQENEGMANFFEGLGFMGGDVIAKILNSKVFGMLQAYIENELKDPNSVSSQLLSKVTTKLKKVVSDNLGINLDEPSNSVWKSAYNAMKLTQEDLKNIKNGDLSSIRQKLQETFLDQVRAKAPQILKDGLKRMGVDLAKESPEVADLLKNSDVNFNDLVEVAKGNQEPLLTKLTPVLKEISINRVIDKLGLGTVDQADPAMVEIKQSLNGINTNDIKQALKGNFSPIVERITPVIKEQFLGEIKSKYNIDLGESDLPLTFQDIRNAVNGDYTGIIEAYKPQLQQLLKDKIKEQTGIDLDVEGKSVSLTDLQNIATGNFRKVLSKYSSQITKYVSDKINEKLGVPIDLKKTSTPLDIDDIKSLSTGNYEPVLQKFKPQIDDFIQSKLKEKTGLDATNLHLDDISTDDILNLSKGNYKPIFGKVKPQILKQVSDQLQDHYGIDMSKYQDDLNSAPITTRDLISLSNGDTTPILSKLKSAAEERTGINENDLRDAITQAKQQVSQVQQQVSDVGTRVKQQVSEVGSQVSQIASQARQQAEEFSEDLQTQRSLMSASLSDLLPPPPGTKTLAFYSNPMFSDDLPPVGSQDIGSAIRDPAAKMMPTVSSDIQTVGDRLISSLRTTGTQILGSGLAVGAGIGSQYIQSEPLRDVTSVGGPVLATVGTSVATKALQGGTISEGLTEGLQGGAEMGVLAGAQLGLSYIPDPETRDYSSLLLNSTASTVQIARAVPSIVSSLSSNAATTGASTLSEATSAGTSSLADLGETLASAEVVTAPVDAVPVLGEVVQGVIGIAGLAASLYFGIKSLFEDDDDEPASVPTSYTPSVQFGA